MRLRKRGDTWYARYWEDGVRVSKSTKCTDKKAAEKVAVAWERDASDPTHARTRGATISDAFLLLLDDRTEAANAVPPRGSMATVQFYTLLVGHWVRILGPEFPLVNITASTVKGYISQRRKEWATQSKSRHVSDHTISKELIALRAALKLAKVDGIWMGDIGTIMPVAFKPAYVPRSRWLPPDEVQKLLETLEPNHAARVAFIVATSAEWSATNSARRADVTTEQGVLYVHLRGTKRALRKRTVPIVSENQRTLLAYALDHAQGSRGLLFAPWGKPQQALRWACKRAGIDYCTPNDLRRTFAQWMRRAGVPMEIVAPMMGHASTAMLQLVYGRLDAQGLESRLRSALWPTIGPPLGPKEAVSDVSGCGEKEDSSHENLGKVSGSSGDRTPNLQIKSLVLPWPLPGKNRGDARGSAKHGPLLAHAAEA